LCKFSQSYSRWNQKKRIILLHKEQKASQIAIFQKFRLIISVFTAIFALHLFLMKVILINTSEKKGGAAVACGRLMRALQKADAEADMLVRDKSTDNPHVIAANKGKTAHWLNQFRFVWERLSIFLQNGLDRKNLFAVSIANSGIPLAAHPAVKSADIIHLHWINQGFLSLNQIKKLAKTGKPIVWTMHDMWPATGICHHSRECESYHTRCEKCMFLGNKQSKDLSTRVFLRKKEIWANANIHFVTCSRWLEKRTRASALINPNNVQAIPNPLDTGFYSPKDKNEARKQFGLPPNKKLILYGAANVTDKRKGIDYYVDACRILSEKYPRANEELELVFFGQAKENIDGLFPFPIHQTGYLTDDETIRNLYNAVDLFVTPSLEENLPNTIMESMSCGTPVVGFSIGGIPEMIDHQQNGFLSDYKSAAHLAEGVDWCLWKADYQALSTNARKKVIECYSEEAVAEKYIQLYRHILLKNTK